MTLTSARQADSQSRQEAGPGVVLDHLQTILARRRQVSDDDVDDQFAQHRGLPEARGNVTSDLRADDDGGEKEDDDRYGILVRPRRL